MSQLAWLPTRKELARTALGIIFATMTLTTLSLLFFLRDPDLAWPRRRVAAGQP